ncbi:MAG: hypothetical protein KC517_02135 [Bacteroidetes bacterium]|jgi:hypothetical protein|nr:hypothetical protein [Bacteroidota bacterium]
MSEEILDNDEIKAAKNRTWKWLRALEIIGFVLLLVGIGFKYMHYAGADIITLFAVLVLVIVYLALFAPLISAQKSNKTILGFSIFAGFTLATTLIGILFKFFLWSGADNIVIVGYASVLFGLIFIWIKMKGENPELNANKAIYRLWGFGLIAIALFHVNARKLFDFNHNYRASENLLDAFENTYTYPDNSAMNDRYMELRRQHFDSINAIDWPETPID